MEVLRAVCGRLEKAEIPYMITGSMAANFYAVPRMTRDIDIVLEVKTKDVERMLALFRDDFYIDREAMIEAIGKKGMFNIIHGKHVVKVDFIVRKDAPYREVEFGRRRKIEVDKGSVFVVSPEDLILSKLCWAKESLSELQLRDVRNLLKVVKNLDNAYLDRWVRSMGLEGVYEKAKA